MALHIWIRNAMPGNANLHKSSRIKEIYPSLGLNHRPRPIQNTLDSRNAGLIQKKIHPNLDSVHRAKKSEHNEIMRISIKAAGCENSIQIWIWSIPHNLCKRQLNPKKINKSSRVWRCHSNLDLDHRPKPSDSTVKSRKSE